MGIAIRSSAAAAALALAGCAAPGPLPTGYEVRVSPAWSDATVVFAALDAWHEATTGRAQVAFHPVMTADLCPSPRLEGSGPVVGCISIAPASFQEVNDLCAPAGHAIGCTNADRIEISPMTGDLLAQTLTHEIGHGLGLSHDSSKDAVMYPDGDGSQTITARDVEQYSALR